MKYLLVALVLLSSQVAHAWDTRENPDRMPSIGWGIHGGQQPGLASDNKGYTQFGMDFRFPVSNMLTLTADYAQTTLSSVPEGINTDSRQFGLSVRVYLADFK